jgi:O-antigen ligase
LQVAGVLFTGGALALTQARSAWLGLLAGGITLGCWRLARRRGPLAFTVVSVASLAFVLGPYLYAFLVQSPPPEGTPLDTLSLAWRSQLWVDILPALQDHAWMGIGIVRLSEALTALYPGLEISEITRLLNSAHNLFLDVAVSFGLPGLVAFLAMWVGAGRMIIRAHRAAADPWLRALLEGLSAGLIACFIHGFYESLVLNGKVGLPFWLALGLAAGAAHYIQSQRAAAPQSAAIRAPFG